MTHTLDRSRLNTVQLVPPTPFSVDGKRMLVDTIAQHAREMRDAGITVFVPAAGTGEFHSLSHDEIIACVKSTRQAIGDRCLVIAPIGFSLEDAATLGRRAADVGADALLSMPLVHPYLSDEGVGDYLHALRCAVPLPILIYKKGHAPSDDLLTRLAVEDVICGVKYAVNDVNAFNRFAQLAPAQLGLYCGTAERFAPFFMLAGATGFTSGTANICPRLSLEFHRLLATKEFSSAMELLKFIQPIEEFRARQADSFNIGAIKGAMQFRGHDFGPLRPPQRQIPRREQEELSEIVQRLLDAEQSMYSTKPCLGSLKISHA